MRTLASAASLGMAAHPAGLRRLFLAELWERFSYYGMRALLVLYMTAPALDGGLGWTTPEAARIYGNYTMAVYLLAIPGGFIADVWLSPARAVLIGGFMITCGHIALAVPTLTTFFLGLTLIALGTGLFKPSISALVGALYARDDPRRDAGFSIFYMGINIGALAAPIVTGFLAQSDWFKAWLSARGLDPSMSWHWGFAAAAVGMALAMVSFAARGEWRLAPGTTTAEASGRATESLRNGALITTATIALLGLLVLSDREGYTWLRAIFLLGPLATFAWLARRPDATARRLAAVAVLFVAAMLFWAIFDQAALSIALFADQLTRNELLGRSFPSAWYQALNPLMVIALAPLMAGLWMRLGHRQPSAAAKFALALGFLAASFLLMVPAARLAAAGLVSPWWLVGLFLLQTIGELCLSPVGLSMMTRLAPPAWTGAMLGIWFMAAAWGSKLAGILGAGFKPEDPEAMAVFFRDQALLVGLSALVLAVLVPWLDRLMRDED